MMDAFVVELTKPIFTTGGLIRTITLHAPTARDLFELGSPFTDVAISTQSTARIENIATIAAYLHRMIHDERERAAIDRATLADAVRLCDVVRQAFDAAVDLVTVGGGRRCDAVQDWFEAAASGERFPAMVSRQRVSLKLVESKE